MRVCHLNTFVVRGGAARAMYRIHRGLLKQGVDSIVYTPNKTIDDARVFRHLPKRTYLQKVINRIRYFKTEHDFNRYRKTRPNGVELFSDDRTYHWRDLERQLPPADLYQLNWIAQFVDLGSFMSMVRKPIVWRLSDMYAITGGCHYAMGCDAYKDVCGRCPQLGSLVEHDLAYASWERKARAYSFRTLADFHIVAPSRWLQKQVERSGLLGKFPVHHIPSGIDTDVFRPIPTDGLRESLGLSPLDQVILFVAEGVTNQRKGFHFLTQAIQSLTDSPNLVALTMGANSPQIQLPFRHIHAGAIGSDGLMAALYNAADLTIVPSIEENFPSVGLESIACGTPVIGFDSGGIPEIVRPEETGWLVPVGQVHALRDVLRNALSDAARLSSFGVRCRQVAEREYTLAIQARGYADLYTRVLGQAISQPQSDMRSVRRWSIP